jgi:hypothetical protein
MTAIADQTHEELEKTLGIASGGTTQCGHTPLVNSHIHLRTRARETKGQASRGAIGRAFRRISKVAITQGATNQETIGLYIGTLCCRMIMLRSGESTANLQAATMAMLAGHSQSRSN